jgi:hypothetical protein
LGACSLFFSILDLSFIGRYSLGTVLLL